MTREERIEAALATVGKTTEGPWTRYDHNNMARFEEDPKDWIGYAWAGFGGEPNGTFQGAVAETDRRKDGCREFKERAEFDFDLITAAPDLRDEVIALRAQVERQKCTTDELLWQEIYSLREKLKIAVAAIKSYEPDFDDQEFTHRLGAVDYDQLMEELSEPPQIESEEDKL